MTSDLSAGGDALAALRARIDAIDARIHELLIDRGEIIEALIAVKRTAERGAAFRPAREAAMMEALAGRHRGPLPFVTVEHLWREIISTFTWLQAPFTVHVAAGSDEATRDVARFYFGFTVPFVTQRDASAAIAAVAASESDLAVVRLGPAEEPWWRALDGAEAPRIIARLPFVDGPGRAVATPAVVVSRPLRDPTPLDTAILALDPGEAAPPGAALLAHAGHGAEAELLVAVPAGSRPETGRVVGGCAAPIPLHRGAYSAAQPRAPAA